MVGMIGCLRKHVENCFALFGLVREQVDGVIHPAARRAPSEPDEDAAVALPYVLNNRTRWPLASAPRDGMTAWLHPSAVLPGHRQFAAVLFHGCSLGEALPEAVLWYEQVCLFTPPFSASKLHDCLAERLPGRRHRVPRHATVSA